MNVISRLWLPLLWIVLLVTTATAAVPAGLTGRQRQEFEALSKELNNDIVLYGQVADLDGVPVPEATVRFSARVAGVSADKQFPKVQVRTDAGGCFVAKVFGELLELEMIEKDGYQYRFQYNRERILKSVKKEKRHGLGHEPDKPIVFRVRKLAPPAFVVVHNMTFGKEPGKPSHFDLIKRQWVHKEATLAAMRYSSLDRDWHTDLRLFVEGEAGALRLVLEAGDDASGFVVEKHPFPEVMTLAPERGYRRRVEVPVKEGESPLHLYVKAQGGLFYARLHIEFAERRPGLVAINATSFTNLMGGRGLEYLPWVESAYDWAVNIEHSRKEIRRADLLSGQPIAMPEPRQ
jgi:hypothetical protein